MSDKSPAKKKARYQPPQAPRVVTGLATPQPGHSRSQSVPQVVLEGGNSQSRYRPGSVYPTPSTTARRASVSVGRRTLDGTGPLPAPKFQESPHVDLLEIDNPYPDDPDGHSDKEGSKNGSEMEDRGDEDGGDGDGEQDDGSSICEEDASHFETEEELEAHIFRLRMNFSKQRKSAPSTNRGAPTPPPLSHPSQPRQLKVTPMSFTRSKSVSSSRKGSMPNNDTGGDRSAKEDGNDDVVDEFIKNLVRRHALKSLLSLCKLTHAHEAANLVPLYDEVKNPKWFNEQGILIPHFDLSFSENFDHYGDLRGWGEDFYKVVQNTERMDPSEKQYLQGIEREAFRAALITGGFATMKEARAKNKDGKGEERKSRKQGNSRRSARKTSKGGRRLKLLQDSSLEVAGLEFLADPAYQSSEHSDPDDDGVWTVREPTHRSKKARDLLGALDVKHESGARSRGGKKATTKLKYQKVNVKIHRLKAGRVPQWAVDTAALKKDDELERLSRPNIDRAETQVPQANLIDEFIFENEPTPRNYVDSPKNSSGANPALAANSLAGSQPPSAPPANLVDQDVNTQLAPAQGLTLDPHTTSLSSQIDKSGAEGCSAISVQGGWMGKTELLVWRGTVEVSQAQGSIHKTASVSVTSIVRTQPLIFVCPESNSTPLPDQQSNNRCAGQQPTSTTNPGSVEVLEPEGHKELASQPLKNVSKPAAKRGTGGKKARGGKVTRGKSQKGKGKEVVESEGEPEMDAPGPSSASSYTGKIKLRLNANDKVKK
ncbi:hypothetical protein RhiLY_03212 [Ceratobasidium sp. AG-Ba]|nr:hypothetical protein RhiLY_03212 [Ceratobasidium sp. AG-Ba]